jgi:hypothetical protein
VTTANQLYFISNGEWAEGYDARIELEGADVLLHSRGGATGGRPARNADYEKALRTIIRRLRRGDGPGGPVISRVLIDSRPARKLAPDERILVTSQELSGLGDDEAVALIRARARAFDQAPGVTGGNSTKALRIETHGRSHASIRSTLKLMTWSGKPAVTRLSAAEQNKVTPPHIDLAVNRLRAGEDAPSFEESSDYDVLLDDGTRLAPKKVFGLALEAALGIDAFPGHFHAGWSQPSFRIIDAAGYLIVRKEEASPTPEEEARAREVLPSGGANPGAREGALKLVMHMRRERDARLSRDKKQAFTAEHGTLYCERCGMDPAGSYPDDVADACIEVHHARVQVRDMEDGHVTRLEDLHCLCANCHRVTHRELALAARLPAGQSAGEARGQL